MLWIYGGGFKAGSAGSYDGSALVAVTGGIVVVTINYRLGACGSAHPSQCDCGWLRSLRVLGEGRYFRILR